MADILIPQGHRTPTNDSQPIGGPALDQQPGPEVADIENNAEESGSSVELRGRTDRKRRSLIRVCGISTAVLVIYFILLYVVTIEAPRAKQFWKSIPHSSAHVSQQHLWHKHSTDASNKPFSSFRKNVISVPNACESLSYDSYSDRVLRYFTTTKNGRQEQPTLMTAAYVRQNAEESTSVPLDKIHHAAQPSVQKADKEKRWIRNWFTDQLDFKKPGSASSTSKRTQKPSPWGIMPTDLPGAAQSMKKSFEKSTLPELSPYPASGDAKQLGSDEESSPNMDPSKLAEKTKEILEGISQSATQKPLSESEKVEAFAAEESKKMERLRNFLKKFDISPHPQLQSRKPRSDDAPQTTQRKPTAEMEETAIHSNTKWKDAYREWASKTTVPKIQQKKGGRHLLTENLPSFSTSTKDTATTTVPQSSPTQRKGAFEKYWSEARMQGPPKILTVERLSFEEEYHLKNQQHSKVLSKYGPTSKKASKEEMEGREKTIYAKDRQPGSKTMTKIESSKMTLEKAHSKHSEKVKVTSTQRTKPINRKISTTEESRVEGAATSPTGKPRLDPDDVDRQHDSRLPKQNTSGNTSINKPNWISRFFNSSTWSFQLRATREKAPEERAWQEKFFNHPSYQHLRSRNKTVEAILDMSGTLYSVIDQLMAEGNKHFDGVTRLQDAWESLHRAEAVMDSSNTIKTMASDTESRKLLKSYVGVVHKFDRLVTEVSEAAGRMANSTVVSGEDARRWTMMKGGSNRFLGEVRRRPVVVERGGLVAEGFHTDVLMGGREKLEAAKMALVRMKESSVM